MTAADAVIPPNFDELYTSNQDPWDVEKSWYERRKLAILLASLPKERYGSIWEPGCGLGFSSRALAQRADMLTSSDTSAVAVEQARQRCDGVANVSFQVSTLPAIPVSTAVDLVVVAEFLYYIDDFDAALESLWTAVASGGHLAFVHWAHRPHDGYQSGRAMHSGIAADAARRSAAVLVSHREPDFGIDIYERP